jgi:hypothetical protein
MIINERDIHILKPLLEKELKKMRKFATKERQHFGNGYAFSELESYMELILENMKETLELPENKAAFEARMARIKKPQ